MIDVNQALLAAINANIVISAIIHEFRKRVGVQVTTYNTDDWEYGEDEGEEEAIAWIAWTHGQRSYCFPCATVPAPPRRKHGR